MQILLSSNKPLSGRCHLFLPESSCLRIKHLNPFQKAWLSCKIRSNSERDPYLPPISILSPLYLWSHPHDRLTLVSLTFALPYPPMHVSHSISKISSTVFPSCLKIFQRFCFPDALASQKRCTSHPSSDHLWCVASCHFYSIESNLIYLQFYDLRDGTTSSKISGDIE